MDQVSLLIFDLGGVVVRNNDVVPEFAEILGTDSQTIHTRLAGPIRSLYTGAISVKEFWHGPMPCFPGACTTICGSRCTGQRGMSA